MQHFATNETTLHLLMKEMAKAFTYYCQELLASNVREIPTKGHDKPLKCYS